MKNFKKKNFFLNYKLFKDLLTHWFFFYCFFFFFSFLLFFLLLYFFSWIFFDFRAFFFIELSYFNSFFNFSSFFFNFNNLLLHFVNINLLNEVFWWPKQDSLWHIESFSVSFLRFPFVDDGVCFFFDNRFPYGFLGYGHLHWRKDHNTPFFFDYFFSYNSLLSNINLPIELGYTMVKTDFLYIKNGDYFFDYFLSNFFFENFYTKNFDYDITTKYIYYDSSLDLVEFIVKGFYRDMSNLIIYDNTDLRNSFFWDFSFSIISTKGLSLIENPCYMFHFFILKFLIFSIPGLFFLISDYFIWLFFPYYWSEFFCFFFCFFFLIVFNFCFFFKFFYNFFYIVFRLFFYVFYNFFKFFFWLFFGYFKLEYHEEGQTIFFARHDIYDNYYNWLYNGFDGVEQPVNVAQAWDSREWYWNFTMDTDNKFFGLFYTFFSKTKPTYILNTVNYEFFYFLLDYFFMCIIRIIFLFFIYFFFFFYRSLFIIVLRSEIFYFLYIFIFYFYFFFKKYNDKYIFYYLANLYLNFFSLNIWLKNYIMIRLPFDSFFFLII